MLNTDTKRHIDAARDVLVGVAPNPTTQIDQITYALIYKFMDDMDQAAIKEGGEPSFFVEDLKEYAWSSLTSARLGNQDKLKLYQDALAKFSIAKQLPELFRTIFRGAALPYNSPETLGLFLKEISFFDYTHPEELGNAYEYLLSIMSSQGDAGQFRTPRHIIDFIVDVLNPTKDDKVLDPACGTAGFLVSTYNHILQQHDGLNDSDKTEKRLTPDERKKLMQNLQGYDIDPTMVRIAQVNMYLHQFKNPQIFQYDSLTSDERWNDKFDVILANPPFMSPKGGIKPHSKFSITSNRSEVIFVDYIISHLKPKGRAGIIVPEGIIFQNGNAYKALRKNLVENGLYAVVSLPGGVFQPYSGVKTSILLFDNELARNKSEIAFIKISSDGFELGASKRPISKNDLPEALDFLKDWAVGKEIESSLVTLAKKDTIAETTEFNLSGDRYKERVDHSNNVWPIFELQDLCETVTPPKKIASSAVKEFGKYQVIDQSQNEVAGWTDDEEALIYPGDGLLVFGDHTCSTKFVSRPFAQGADGIKILRFIDSVLPKFVYYVLQANPIESDGYKRHFAKFKEHRIPVPSLELQHQLVNELDGYFALIANANQIIANWKPVININPEWEQVELGELVEIHNGATPSRTDEKFWTNGVIPWMTVADIRHQGRIISSTLQHVTQEALSETSLKLVPKNSVLLCCTSASIGEYAYANIAVTTNQQFNGLVARNESILNSKYLYYFAASLKEELKRMSGKSTFDFVSVGNLKKFLVPLPSIEEQNEIVLKLDLESRGIQSVEYLKQNHEELFRKVIQKLWSE